MLDITWTLVTWWTIYVGPGLLVLGIVFGLATPIWGGATAASRGEAAEVLLGVLARFWVAVLAALGALYGFAWLLSLAS